ncbi:MAG TPA: hypothetical protein VGG95_02100 [Edaphobacter sp.]|jgi:hypothetical protein
MATRKKPSSKVEPIDIAKRLSESLAEKPKTESHHASEVPEIGDMVRIGDRDTEYRVIYLSPNGREVNLEFPGTNLTRNRVQVSDLTFAGHVPRRPKEPPKPRIDAEAVREDMEQMQHAILDHLQGEVARFKKSLKSKGISIDEALDEFVEDTGEHWNKIVEAIEEKLEE